MLERKAAEALLRSWWGGSEPGSLGVYAVLDGARDGELQDVLRRSRLDHTCLIPGPLEPRLQRAAPYLVSLGYRSEPSLELVRRVWGRGRGIFLISPAVLPQVARHLQRFLDAEDPGGGRILIRFYDPAVLPTFLPLATREELDFLFGPIQRFEFEVEAGRRLLRLAWKEERLEEGLAELSADGVRTLASSVVGGLRRGGWPGGRQSFRTGRQPDARFRLRQPLWDALRGEARRLFVSRALLIVQRCWPHTTRRRGLETMRFVVERALAKAATYGLRGRREALHFINWVLTFGEEFDQEPWSSSILLREDLPPSVKVDLLLPKARRVLAREMGR